MVAIPEARRRFVLGIRTKSPVRLVNAHEP
jgi:hypothetical protein